MKKIGLFILLLSIVNNMFSTFKFIDKTEGLGAFVNNGPDNWPYVNFSSPNGCIVRDASKYPNFVIGYSNQSCTPGNTEEYQVYKQQMEAWNNWWKENKMNEKNKSNSARLAEAPKVNPTIPRSYSKSISIGNPYEKNRNVIAEIHNQGNKLSIIISGAETGNGTHQLS